MFHLFDSRIWLLLLLSVLTSSVVCGESIVLSPIADTVLIESAPDNNMGGQLYVNAGTTRLGKRNHGLFKFDVAATLPHGARIRSAALVLEVVYLQQETPTPTDFELRRIVSDWGEGNKISTVSPGAGSTATANEATWNNRFAVSTNTWSIPGGQNTVDFGLTNSATAAIYDSTQSPYIFGPSAELISDVQFWLDHPQFNFGWVLKPVDESVLFTAHRFGSREDPDNTPQLAIDFVPPPTLLAANVASNRFEFSFVAEADQNYIVESSTNLISSWNIVTNIPAQATATNRVVSDALIASPKFFRVVVP